MSELPPLPETDLLAEIQLHDRSLADWRRFLMLDEGDVPCSRYGRNSDECSYWALACEAIYVSANGDDHEGQDALEYYMGLVVNDSDDVLGLIRSYWYAVPEELKPFLDHEENGLNMAQQSTLVNLCERYGVQYDAEHYLVHPIDSSMMPGYGEGWLGGKPGTLYVGVDQDGRASS